MIGYSPRTNTYTDIDGKSFVLHAADSCIGTCPFHKPTEHSMSDWPSTFNWDMMRLDRVCEHGLHHPDPDTPQELCSVEHECDGCCEVREAVECVPNPGSHRAKSLGCICPVLDNSHGKGYMEQGVFVIAIGCELHDHQLTSTGSV